MAVALQRATESFSCLPPAHAINQNDHQQILDQHIIPLQPLPSRESSHVWWEPWASSEGLCSRGAGHLTHHGFVPSEPTVRPDRWPDIFLKDVFLQQERELHL